MLGFFRLFSDILLILYQQKKAPKPFSKKNVKNLQSQIIFPKNIFKALWSDLIFRKRKSHKVSQDFKNGQK